MCADRDFNSFPLLEIREMVAIGICIHMVILYKNDLIIKMSVI